MEKDWPPLEECPQYRAGLMDPALYKYPWEEDDYAFDFEAFYPPLPDGPPWLRKLLEVTKYMVPPPYQERIGKVDRGFCPVCYPHVDLDPSTKFRFETTYPEIGDHPVWDMDPIPNPFHILEHFYGPRACKVCPRLVTPEELESTKKFLKDLRATRGYNVNTDPHPGLVYSPPFWRSDLERDFRIRGVKGVTLKDHVEDGLYCAIDYISEKTGKSYQLCEALKLVNTLSMALVTFSAMPTISSFASPAYPETFIASLREYSPPPPVRTTLFNSIDPNLFECLLLPDYDAPCKTEPHPNWPKM